MKELILVKEIAADTEVLVVEEKSLYYIKIKIGEIYYYLAKANEIHQILSFKSMQSVHNKLKALKARRYTVEV